MTDDAGELVDAEPRRRPGDGEPRAALGRGLADLLAAPTTARSSPLDALLAHDAWTREHPGQLRGTRAGDVHLPARVEAAAPVVAVEVERMPTTFESRYDELATTPAPDHKFVKDGHSESAPEPAETAALDVETLDIAERMRRMRDRQAARG